MRVILIAFALCVSFIAIPLANATTPEACEARLNKPTVLPGQQDQQSKLSVLRQCVRTVDDRAACNRFVGRGLEILFKNVDFKAGNGEYMLANDIANGLSQPGNSGWRLLGKATDQAALAKAQDAANTGQPVVAAKTVVPNGHVVIVLRGQLERFDADGHSWGTLNTPNTASFFLDKPYKGFIGCPLSAVWKKPDGVLLYTKQ
jgi:hypothetical protein